MDKLLSCAILIAFVVGSQAEVTAETNLVSESTRYKISNDQEELKDDYKVSLLKFANNNFKDLKINFVLSTPGCFTCDRILGVLMDASVLSFLTINDIALTNYSVVENAAWELSQIKYYKFVVLLIDNVSEFSEKFDKLRLIYTYNSRAQHLIFIVTKPDDEDLEMIFEECWFHRVLNVAVIISNQKEAYTYNPYLKKRSEMREKVEDWSRLFYDKLRNMNGHLIRTRYLPFAGNDRARWLEKEKRYQFFGSDFGYAQAFFQSVNATPSFINLTLDVVPCYRDYNYRAKTWNERKFHDAELWMNFMPLQLKVRDRSERAYPLRQDSIRIFVPKSGVKTPSIFEPYDDYAWTCIVLSLVTFALYSCVLYKWRGIDDNAFLRTLGFFLGKNLANRRHCFLEKFTFLIFTMASLIILSIYQGALYRALAVVTYYPEIDTMPELYNRIRVINTFNVIIEFLREYLDPNIRLAEFRATDDYVDFMKTHRDEAYAFPESVGQNTAKLKILSENGIPFYHMMSDYSVPGFVSHTLPYGSPYLEQIEKVFLACKEAGLNQYWDSEVQLDGILSGISISNVAEERTLTKLSLQTQLYGFYIWGMGLLVSSFCFLAEIYFYKNGITIKVFSEWTMKA